MRNSHLQPPHDSPHTLDGIINEKSLSEVSKELNVQMVESNLNTLHWILCGDLNLTSVDWNTLSSDDQHESSFSKSIEKFNPGLLTYNAFLQRDVSITDVFF